MEELSMGPSTFVKGQNQRWNFIGLECHSALVVDIFEDESNAPWKLWSKMIWCKKLLSLMDYSIFYISREENFCAYKLILNRLG
ncbi:hypothetical protein Lal_00022451 [Lupinus albus]|nr:hypothetical protein Lal_00022451 [Lupinus albus]